MRTASVDGHRLQTSGPRSPQGVTHVGSSSRRRKVQCLGNPIINELGRRSNGIDVLVDRDAVRISDDPPALAVHVPGPFDVTVAAAENSPGLEKAKNNRPQLEGAER